MTEWSAKERGEWEETVSAAAGGAMEVEGVRKEEGGYNKDATSKTLKGEGK